MFVMHIKQFPQFIPSYKRKYALKAIQLNFAMLVFFSLSLSLVLLSSYFCCPSVWMPHFLFQAFLFASNVLPSSRCSQSMPNEEIICEKGKGNDIVGRLLT